MITYCSIPYKHCMLKSVITAMAGLQGLIQARQWGVSSIERGVQVRVKLKREGFIKINQQLTHKISNC